MADDNPPPFPFSPDAKACYGKNRTGTRAQRAAVRAASDAAGYRDLKNNGYSLIATNPCFPTYTSAGSGGRTNKSAHKATAAASNIRLVFMNTAAIQGQGLNNNFNSILVGAALQKAGSNAADETGLLQPCFFPNGRRLSHVDPGALLYSEPAAFRVARDETFFVRTYLDLNFPAAPSAPSLTPSATGGALVPSAAYYVCVVYVYADGMESLTSAATQAAIPSGGGNTGSLTVTSPAANPAALGWKCYISARNAPNGAGLFFKSGDIAPVGTGIVLTAEAQAYGLQMRRAGGYISLPGGCGGAGGTLYDGLGTGEGGASGDQTQNGFVSTTPQALSNPYYPAAILGITAEPQKTVSLVGDSIQAGTGDNGCVYASGGFGTRALINQMLPCYDPSANPLHAYVRVPIGGETMAIFASQLATNQFSRSRLDVVELATNVISNYGTNDAVDLPALKANTLYLAAYYAERGMKFFQCSILPKTLSSDGWRTAANQTSVGSNFETFRVAYNNWLRDGGASGFVAQAASVAGVSGMAEFIDVCKYTEVDAANVLTQNGGRWRVPTGYAPIHCTVTGASGAAQWTDSSKAWARNAWKGWAVVFTSGANANKVGCVGWNDAAGTLNTYSAVGVAPANGDTYDICMVATTDGTHPTSLGHIWAALTVQEKLSLLI